MARKQTGKLTDDQIEEIYVELRAGTTHKEIGKMFGVSTALIGHINNGINYSRPGWSYPIVDRKVKPIPRDDKFYDTLVLESWYIGDN